ncbi:MAG: PIN domain-containing protein [Leptospiraceae bacterium]|nr:PIN domain-containing protein [Leptospiraceae bacterium]
MKHIYRLFIAIGATALVFFAAFHGGAEMINAAILAGAILVLSAFILYLDRLIPSISGEVVFCVSGGVFAGLIAGFLIQQLLSAIGILSGGVALIAYVLPVIFFGYVGSLFARSPGLRVFGGSGSAPNEPRLGASSKILDTSVIIDGRILDIAETRFIEGPLIIPNFVLREIQLISDSPDPIKRNRGRRGLDMLNKLQQRPDIKVQITYLDYADTREVDAKLIKAAREIDAKLITNDFNLNKVAELQGVEVLNLNSLTNALKPVVLPGEDILIDIIKEGKDENQGIGYLEDGTMVVVENGGALLGKAVKVNVTSIIQTAAGKMIFTRAQGDDDSDDRNDQSSDRRDRNEEGGNKRRNRGRRGGGGGNNNDDRRGDREQSDGDREAVGGGRRRR